MISLQWMLAICFSFFSDTCKTFGSGIIQPFNGSGFYVRSNCMFTLTRFTHNRVECVIIVRRGNNGLLVQVEIIINKVKTVLEEGRILVEKNSVSLPYDHTYQHIFHYGLYTKLRSSVLPLSVTWHNVPGGIDTLWVELDQELSSDLTGLCGKLNISASGQQLIMKSELPDETCQTLDPATAVNTVCRSFLSFTLDCLQARTLHYLQLCEANIYRYETSKYVSCAFFKEVVEMCGDKSYVQAIWRSVTECEKPICPGELVYVEKGAAFVPSCSNLNPRLSSGDLISSCVCPTEKVLNDHVDGFHCVDASSCPCVFSGKSYAAGDIRSTKCQLCMCDSGKWHCSENVCPTRCLIEGQFVTSFDGKQYVVPGKCAYVASQGSNWTITIQFFKNALSLKTVILQLFQETYTFSHNTVKIGEDEITELHESEHALVFWQSSMYVQVHTSIGMKLQVQMSPEIQLYITPLTNHSGLISGLCGNNNNDTTDDFTSSSGIVENSAQPFALSWSVDTCTVNIPSTCISTDNEIFADEMCSVLNDPRGIFAKCHAHIPSDYYHTACIQRTCNCGSVLQQCLCVALGSYAKACASLGVEVGDWRTATNCTVKCQKNQVFSYNVQACNSTCRSLSGPDPRCGLGDAPVEGCGCPEGTHLNQGHTCTPKTECVCHYYGGTIPPGSFAVDGRNCICENGELKCSDDCGCRNGKVCVHCGETPMNTAQKTCDSLSKPMVTSMTCDSGCYCPHNQYEDHHGNCVLMDNCTCVYSGEIFNAGQHVRTNCKTCVCGQGQWHCTDEPCPGTCQVYGNGQYQSFDSKWYRFDGHCQYTLVEDDCGKRNGSFSIRVETVPCCDEALTCSRAIVLDLQGAVTLTLSDMKVTQRRHDGWTVQADPLYSVHTVGLYIIVSVPSRGITLIWDKHTRITVELHSHWRNQVCGLCGNFDSSEMNDLQISGSEVVSSPLAFGNSWKITTPPCTDVTTEIFPCERNSYCSAWAQRRCLILTGDMFKDCHLKVDPQPYYHACVQESCSCEFEGKFLGFCTAVAAYAEACSDQDVCINWRTPDLCPVYCDYYNEQGQCTWHYDACGEMLTCSERNYFPHKLEGCYPRCSKETPYYDENTGECTKLKNCTCYFNETIIHPSAVVLIQSIECRCKDGRISCRDTTTSTPTTSTTSTPETTTTRNNNKYNHLYTNNFNHLYTRNNNKYNHLYTNNFNHLYTRNNNKYNHLYINNFNRLHTNNYKYNHLYTNNFNHLYTRNNTRNHLYTNNFNHLYTRNNKYNHLYTNNFNHLYTRNNKYNHLYTNNFNRLHTNNYNNYNHLYTNNFNHFYTRNNKYSHLYTNNFNRLHTKTHTTEISTNEGFTIASSATDLTTTDTSVTTTATEKPYSVATTQETTEFIQTETPLTSTAPSIPQTRCECKDLKSKKSWSCGEAWTEDCFHKTCRNNTIELTPVVCPVSAIPICPRNQVAKVSDGCCETWKCDCRCEIYGDPHYITFQGLAFDFLEDCTYILVEEQSPRHHLTIVVDNYDCVPGLDGSCAKGIILIYQNNIARLNIIPQLFTVQATLNNVTIVPPYEEKGWRFETTGYIVTITLPEIRSHVSLSPGWTLVVSLAMEHFHNNTQGQCGVCGVGSCVRKGGQLEDDSCCEKTAYDWLYSDTLKPACFSAPRNVPCHHLNTPTPTSITTTTTSCPASSLCKLLDHPVFSNCSRYVNLIQQRKNCEYDSCRNGICSSLEQAADECKKAGFCIDWRKFSNGSCGVLCPKGQVYQECPGKLDDFCNGGVLYPGASLEDNSTGCFCPSGQFKAGNHSNICVSDCSYCKGPRGEPRRPGEVWESNCYMCTCNKQTLTEECVPKPPVIPTCSPNAVLINSSCCGDQICVDKTCIHNGKTFKVGDKWNDTSYPCTSFSCGIEGIQTETKVCPKEHCEEEGRIWDDRRCCFTCKTDCSPQTTSINMTVDSCTSVVRVPLCHGHCVSEPRIALFGNLQVEHKHQCCKERSSERRPITLQCSDHTTRQYTYNHITSCECRACLILR
ncbi:mucin-6 [Antennarius striatus]|uniref:mucin-6 n=1 Tax=Antennarius striatus TaxID=241820 RepID=UPI0035B1AEE7